MVKFLMPLTITLLSLLYPATAPAALLKCAGTPFGCQAPERVRALPSPLLGEDSEIEPIHQLIRFLSYLSHSEDRHAYALIAPSSIRTGDPIAYHAALDWASFSKELDTERQKFAKYHLGNLRWESPDRLRVFVHFEGDDNDEVLLIRENAQWRVADPIHIIR